MKYLHLFPSSAHNEMLAVANYAKEVTPDALDVLLRSGQMRAMPSEVAQWHMEAAVRHLGGFVDVIVHK